MSWEKHLSSLLTSLPASFINYGHLEDEFFSEIETLSSSNANASFLEILLIDYIELNIY